MGPATTRVSNSYGDQNRDCGNFSTTTNIGHVHIGTTTSTPQPVDVKGEILRWISPLKLPDGHRGAKQRRIKGVGDRFVETDRFRGWAHGSSDPTFFCSGDPGSGKTCISALVIDTLRSRADTQNFPLLYLYCNYATYKELYATDLIAELLKKALAELHTIPEEVSREFTELKYHDSGRSPPKDPLGKLCAVLTTFERVYICIDALDEFPSGQRPELLQSLKVLTQQPSKARLFLTGRPLIEHEIKRYLGEGTQTISIKPSEEDIKEYITHMLARDPYPHEMGPKLRNDIMRILPQKASGIFLLVRLKMNAILEAVNPYDRMERLRGMDGNQGLWDEYSKTLVRIHEQGPVKSTIALKALMWLCRSKRPLRVGELCHALAVERGSTVSNCNKASSIWTILGCCLGLATVDKETSTIQEVSTVHLIHSTLKDYLRNNPLLFQGIDLTIAETCLTYLNFEDIKSRPLHLFTASAGDPFLQYASCYWGEHAREDAAGCMEALAKKLLGLHAVTAQDTRVTRIGGLLQSYWSRFVRGAHPPHRHLQDLATPERSGYDKHISAKLLLFEKSWPWGRDPKDLPHGFSGLHCAAFFGLRELAVAFLDTKDPNLSRGDITGSTPLTWAARNGHAGLVQLLLKQGNFDHEVQDNDGCTPFSWAARNGHKEVVELFLQEAAISRETKDSFGRTPLSWASGNGHQGVVGLLLGRGKANPETKDYHGRTPLSWASGGGHGDVVRLLLGTGEACPNSADNDGRTSASWAAEAGYEGVVSLLLHQQGVGPDSSDCNGRTLISRAAASGCWPVVKLLLERDGALSGMRDNGGMAPLSWAASMGNEEVVRLFMEKGKAGNDSLNKECSTSLWWAAGNGHAGVVKLLLEQKGVNPNFVGEYRQTPLVRAAMHGHERVVKLLLESGRVDRNLADSFGRTPLSWAAGSWRDEIVKLLLKNGDINTKLADKDGWTPLSWAARNGDEGVVQLLLEEGNACPDFRDTEERTPVSWAASEGHEKVVDLLLSRPDVNPNSTDRTGRTPLSWAAGNGREAVTKLLLDRSNIELNAADDDGRTPLSWAARNRRVEIMQLLVRHPGVNPDFSRR